MYFINVPKTFKNCYVYVYVPFTVISCVHCTLGSSDGIFVKNNFARERARGPPGSDAP